MKNKQWQGQLNIIHTIYYIYILLVTLGRREVRIIGGNSISLDDRRVYIYEDASQWAEMSGLAA